MAVEKISISLDEEIAASARIAAEAAGLSLSAWLSQAAAKAARLEAGLQAVAEYEAEFGPLTDEGGAWAKDILDRHGIGLHR